MAYFSDYPNKALHEIVFPGSHDAGISSGGGNAKTQSFGILGQANAGCRYFDIRVLEHNTGIGANKTTNYDTYHAQFMPFTKKTKRPAKVAGTYGSPLDRVLEDCLDFLENASNEFLILRFSKCTGWVGIANKVITGLGDAHYKGTGNLNTKTAGELAGSIITVFDDPAKKYLANYFGPGTGIIYVKSLVEQDKAHWYSKKTTTVGAYDPGYNGMQYFGKFGATTTVGSFKRGADAEDAKIKANIKKQLKNMTLGSGAPPEVLGMMYWTSTGVFQNIINRNNKMWNGVNSAALKEVWSHGMYEAISDRAPYAIQNQLQHFNFDIMPQHLKAFMPNIVMMDDVDSGRCNTIWDLNNVAEQHLQSAVQAVRDGHF